MKRILSLTTLLLFSLVALAQEFTVNDITYNITSTNYRTVAVKQSYYPGNIVIPESIYYGGKMYSVTSIGEYAFADCSGLTSVSIPNSVTTIGGAAFCRCYSMTSITIPNSVTTIGIEAFMNCKGLTSVEIPNSVTTIGESAFEGCTGLTSVTIPNSVTTIGESAFASCSGLKSITVDDDNSTFDSRGECNAIIRTADNTLIAGCLATTIPSSVTTIGEAAFRYYSSLTSITIPNNVTKIGEKAFEGCSGLTSVTIPNVVTSIGDFAFRSCSGLTSVTIPNSVTTIGGSAFWGCHGLTSVEISNSVTVIDDFTFGSCSNLTSVEIPNSVTKIGEAAFSFCSGLTFITIPNSVTKIGKNAFENCTGLLSVTIPNSVKEIDEFAFYKCSRLTSITIPNSLTTIGDYAFSDCTRLTSVEIPNSVTTIGEAAFEDCPQLNSVTIPNSVTTIGIEAFMNCKGLTSIEIPNSVTEIGGRAFANCSGLTSVEFPNSVTTIGERAFAGCSGLTSVSIPNSVTTIVYGFFADCSGLTSITIPNSVTTIGGSAFSGCSRLFSVTIPNSVTEIGGSAFRDCSSLSSITIPNSVTTIGGSAFWGCSRLSSITIPNSVTKIDEYTFGHCSSLTSITIPNSVTEIGLQVFVNSGLTSVTIPNSVTTIRGAAFWGCSDLTSVTIPNSVTEIGGYAFQNCSSLTSVIIPNSVTKIGMYAFDGCCSLSEVHALIATPFAIEDNTFNTYDETMLSVPEGTADAYKETDGWKNFKEIIENEEKPAIKENITFADVIVKATCVRRWDTDGDGELSKDEAAVVTDLGKTFSNIESFDELQYFTGLTSIGKRAFYGCTGLTSITIPSSVTSIGEEAFYDCRGLTSITIPSSVTSIGDEAFRGCTGLTSITIPELVSSFGWGTFLGCSGLTSIRVASGNPTFDSRGGCNAIIRTTDNTLIAGFSSTIIPNSVTSISAWAFHGCSGLTSVTIPNSVTKIGDSAFAHCSSLTSVTIPNSVTEIGLQAFEDCSSLTSITIPNSVTKIDEYTFSRCSSLTSVTIPNSVMTIGFQAFINTGLTSVTIPNSVMEIGESAFYGCSDLSEVISLAETPFAINDKAFNTYDKTKLYVPAGTADVYKATGGWKNFKNIIEEVDASQITITADNKTMVYGHALPEFTFKVEGGTLSGVPAITCEATFASPVGTYPIIVTQGTVANPNVTYVAGTLTITEASPDDDPYDLPIISKARTITFSSFMNSSTNIKGNIIDGIYYNFPSNSGYDSSAGCLTFNNISNWPVGLKPGDLTTKNQFTGIIMKLVGKGVIYAEGQLSGNMYLGSTYDDYKIGSEFFSENYRTKTSIGEYDFDEPTYVYIHTTTFGETLSSNSKAKLWSIEIRPSSATTDNVKITANDITMTYGSNVPRLTFSTSGSELQGTPELSTTANAKSPVGTYKIIVNKGSVSNSSVELIDGTLTITKAPLTISVGEYNKVEGEDNPEFVLTYNGFKNNETEAVLTKRPVITTSAIKDSESGEYAITVSGAEAENYDITYVAGKLTVKAKPEPEPEPDPKPVIVIEPVETTTMNSESLRGQDLTNNVIDGIYYNVGEDGYDRSDWSVVISQPTNMAQVENKEPGSEDVKEKFNGIIMRVANGKGLIIVKAKTSGIAQLAVQVGNSTPMTASCTEKGDMEVSYDINEDTYVYIYAILDSSNAPTRASSDGEVRIYGIKVSPGAVSGITNMKSEITTDNRYYNLSGQRRTQLHKGINIVRPAGGRLQGKNGKKVFVP